LLQIQPGYAQVSLQEINSLYKQAIEKKNHREAARYGYEIASHYTGKNDANKTIEYLIQSLSYAKKAGDTDILHVVAHALGMQYSQAKKYSKALEYFQDALFAARKASNNDLIKEDLINISITHASLNKPKRSITSAEEALSLAITSQDFALQEKCYQLLAGYYQADGNKKKSTEYHAQYNLLVTARRNEALKAEQIAELEQHVQEAGLETQVAQDKLSAQNQKLLQTSASLRVVERSLQSTVDNLSATSDSLKAIEAINHSREMEIDLLQKDKELAQVKIREQEAQIANEALIRNFIGVIGLLSIALVTVLVINNRKKVKANKQIAEQNKNIRSSINYARRIQQAMLPKSSQYPSVFENSFVLFKPRDTVSGDFYWMSDVTTGHNTDVAFAAVDCTGHGVPGAFMSMIGMKALNGLVTRGLTEPDAILNALDVEIRTALRQDVSGNSDGMDISLCIYHQKDKVLEFSGAKSPLIYIKDHELFKIKGDTHGIGGRKKNDQPLRFAKHEIKIDKPTVIYLFSDGYKDQFGGPENKKFLGKKMNTLLLQIHELPMEQQLQILETAFEEWKGTHEQTDDVLVMGIKLQ
jgi:serine phosphatase RsbU (regulator of sigma subunit)